MNKFINHHEVCEAIILQAVQDYSRRMTRKELQVYADAVQAEAEQWLFSDSSEPHSFLWCCYRAGIEDPEEWRERAVEERQSYDRRKSIGRPKKREVA